MARADDIEEGGRLIVRVRGRSIGIFKVDGAYYALLNRCPHAGGELCKGDLVGAVESSRPGSYSFDADRKLLSCPWHGWEFDITTGRSYLDPHRTRVRAFPVSVESGTTISSGPVEGPYRAETFPIRVEEDYLVIDLVPRRPAAPATGAGAR